jgi:N-acetyl-1-D-myo-inositol-2-amino-2-deoxy-alpha-D-glucopyranoside deacetylase
MKTNKTILFFGAHPDDESVGIGSTLAQYAQTGSRVYVACSTGGEAGTLVSSNMVDQAVVRQVRLAELESAVKVLGLSGVFNLGYKDSGLEGKVNTASPDTLVEAPLQGITERMVRIIRYLQPDVVITHEPGGGYACHPDHIITHDAAVGAFYAASDPMQYPEAGPAYQPKKLYVSVTQRKFLKLFINLMKLCGRDPRHFGQNRDIDLSSVVGTQYPVHAVIHLERASIQARNRAVACYASQTFNQTTIRIFNILEKIEKVIVPRDYFMRYYPPSLNNQKEQDLFQGID